MKHSYSLLAMCIFVMASCSLFNREGPHVTCADLGGGAKNACKEGIIASCSDGATVTATVCDDSAMCENGWQTSGAYRCSQSDPIYCPQPKAVCGGACVDLQVDSVNCGACGTACPTDGMCQAGACTSVSSVANDGGRDAADGAVVADGGSDPPNAGPGGDISHLPCGTAQCSLPGETCCISGFHNGLAYSCVNGPSCAGAPGIGKTALKCSGAANCAAGTVCCVRAFRESGNDAASACKATCGGNEAQLCDLNAAPTGCPAAKACSSTRIGDWGLPQTFATCGGLGG